MEDLIGQSFGRYHIVEKLGEGGMAVVYKAYDTRLERDVAIKFIRSDLFGKAIISRILSRFEREAKAMAKLSHANIIKILDYGDYEGFPYIVMEYLPGGTIKKLLGKPFPFKQAANFLSPIANALNYAHGQKILHRDIKPSNILLSATGIPVLTDFGIAKLIDNEDAHTLTGTGVGVGTPEYMAPEQGLGKGVNERADIYALGIVFYEMITGKKPYEADTPLAILLKQVNDPLPRPGSIIPDLPEEVEKVLFKALAKNPEERYQNMGEFETALSGLQKLDEVPVIDNQSAINPPLHEESESVYTTEQTSVGSEIRQESNLPVFPSVTVGDDREIKSEIVPANQESADDLATIDEGDTGKEAMPRELEAVYSENSFETAGLLEQSPPSNDQGSNETISENTFSTIDQIDSVAAGIPPPVREDIQYPEPSQPYKNKDRTVFWIGLISVICIILLGSLSNWFVPPSNSIPTAVYLPEVSPTQIPEVIPSEENPIVMSEPTQTTAALLCSTQDFTSSDWQEVNPKGTSTFERTTDSLKIIAVGGDQDLYNDVNMDAPRMIKRFPKGDFLLITHVTVPDNYAMTGYQGAGLLLYFNYLNYAWVTLEPGSHIGSAYTLMGVRKDIFNGVYVNSGPVYLAFKTSGFDLYAGYSEDGIHYTWSDPVVFDTSDIRSGLTVLSAWDSPGFSGTFDCFDFQSQ